MSSYIPKRTREQRKKYTIIRRAYDEVRNASELAFNRINLQMYHKIKKMYLRDVCEADKNQMIYDSAYPNIDYLDDNLKKNLKGYHSSAQQNKIEKRRHSSFGYLRELLVDGSNKLTCRKFKLRLQASEQPIDMYEDAIYWNYKVELDYAKRNPFSLLHLSAVEVIKNIDSLSFDMQGQLFIMLKQRNLSLRAGDISSRRTYQIHNIIKQSMYWKLNQRDLVDFDYFRQIKKNRILFVLHVPIDWMK